VICLANHAVKRSGFRLPLCDYNGETTPSNNLEYMAEEKMACLRIQMVR